MKNWQALQVCRVSRSKIVFPLTRGYAPGPHWGLRCQTHVIGSRYSACHSFPLPPISQFDHCPAPAGFWKLKSVISLSNTSAFFDRCASTVSRLVRCNGWLSLLTRRCCQLPVTRCWTHLRLPICWSFHGHVTSVRSSSVSWLMSVTASVSCCMPMHTVAPCFANEQCSALQKTFRQVRLLN